MPLSLPPAPTWYHVGIRWHLLPNAWSVRGSRWETPGGEPFGLSVYTMTGGIIVSICAWHWIVTCYTPTCALRNCLKFSCQDKSTTLGLHLGSLSNIMLEKSRMKQRDSVTRTGTSYSGTALNLCREVRSEDVCLFHGLYNLNNHVWAGLEVYL